MTESLTEGRAVTIAEMREAIGAAARRLTPHGIRTALTAAPSLGRGVHLKREDQQRTGSFKFRGALNKILILSSEQRKAGIVTSSTGNHGLAVAEALRLVGGKGTIVVSSSAAPYKVAKLQRAGLEIITYGAEPMGAELEARALAERSGRVYISPYNDADVIAGQGTTGVEIAEQLPDVDVVYVAVGGGGLIAGIATHLKSVRPSVRIVGCWPQNAPAMHASIRAGQIVHVKESPTLSDGTEGNLEPGAITLPLCRELIDEHVLVSEDEISAAMRDAVRGEGVRIEGAAGVAIAGFRKLTAETADHAERNSVIVLCGGNVSNETLNRIERGAA